MAHPGVFMKLYHAKSKFPSINYSTYPCEVTSKAVNTVGI